MTTFAPSPGDLSGLSYAIRADQVYGAPTNNLDCDVFDFNPDPQTLTFTVERRSFNTTGATRAGKMKQAGTFSGPFFETQGAPLMAAHMGQDILSGNALVAATVSADVAANAQTFTLTATPAVPAGLVGWDGTWFQFQNGGVTDLVFVLSYNTSTKVAISTPVANAHTVAGGTHGFSISHNYIELNAATANSRAYGAFNAQYGNLSEDHYAGGLVGSWTLTGSADNKLMQAWQMAFNTLKVEATTLTNAAYAAGESSDVPFVLGDGGFYSNRAPADAAPSLHGRLTTLSLVVSTALIEEQWGGNPCVQSTPGARTYTATWHETAGEQSAGSLLFANYVQTQKSLGCYFAFNDTVTGNAWGIIFPNAQIIMHKKVQAAGTTVGYDGSMVVREGAGGYAAKISHVNTNLGTVALL